MINEIKFALKVLAFSILLVVFMQFRVGHTTLEAHLLRYAQESRVVGFAQQAAAGAVSIVGQGLAIITQEVKKLWGASPTDHRGATKASHER